MVSTDLIHPVNLVGASYPQTNNFIYNVIFRIVTYIENPPFHNTVGALNWKYIVKIN